MLGQTFIILRQEKRFTIFFEVKSLLYLFVQSLLDMIRGYLMNVLPLFCFFFLFFEWYTPYFYLYLIRLNELFQMITLTV